MNFRILGAVLKKDALSLAPIVTLTALLFLADPIIERLELVPQWATYSPPMILVALVVLVMSVFQLDSPASLSDDWLCRPAGKRELIGAKLLLVVGAVYLPRAVGAFIADLGSGFSVAEASLDALLLQDEVSAFVLPILLFAAIVTRTFVQGFGALIAIFIGVFVLPTPFIRPPGPLNPGLREGLFLSGVQWLAVTPMKLTALALLAIGFWLMYWRRRIVAARILMAFTVCISVLLLALPMALVPWNTTFSIQRAFGPESGAETSRISLRSSRLCFPATRRAELASDAAFVAASQLNGVRLWDSEELHDIAPDSIGFLTSMEPRGLPPDWRVTLSYVQADYSQGDEVLYSLRPTEYFTDRAGDGALVHAWMLPDTAVERLREVRANLDLTYSLTLLKPREYVVSTDGKRHALPGLGYCSAKLDEPRNLIDVDCFSVFNYPAQISAQLNEIPASRVFDNHVVYGHNRTDFAPAFVQWPYGQHVKLAIGSPRLARHESITVSAWDAAGHFQKSLRLPGILGANADTCPLPAGNNHFQNSSWRDAAPHETNSIGVDAGVQLEVLDFGGTGSPVLLLPGLGATAHSYDELAPLLAQKHRVIAITRRGTGNSSRPDFGFDTPRLAHDVLEVMNAMKLDKVLLVGHSIAGDELTWLGGHHPDRFNGLVYLDAAYDRASNRSSPAALRLRELNRLLPPEPPFPPQALLNFDAMTRLLLERGHVRMPEGELIAGWRMNEPYFAGSPSIDARTQQAIAAAIQAPDYSAVKIPALAIYALDNPHEPPSPWYDANDPELMANLAERSRITEAMKRESIDLFKRNVKNGQVLEMPNATHYLIQSNQREVFEAIEKFAAEL
jgi:non-heme chloroperoxidase